MKEFIIAFAGLSILLVSPVRADETETDCLAPTEIAETETEEEEETESETEASYSDDDYYALSHIINAEAGNCDWTMMAYVGSVVLNRVESSKFPDTITDVVWQQGQYSPTINGMYWNEPTDGALEVTEYLLENGSVLPADVLYQANFVQGAIYTTLSTSYSTMYFCYG